MKRSIIVAFLILAGVVGWLGSGQITNVNAQDEENSNTTENKDINSYKSDDNSNENEELVFSVETKIFKASLIDLSIDSPISLYSPDNGIAKPIFIFSSAKL